jgi:hypothetical protein
MAQQKYVISRRKHRTQFVDSVPNATCTSKIRKRFLDNLRRATYSRVDPRRAPRSRQLLEQIEATQATATHRPHVEQPVAVTLPSLPPAVVERQGPPNRIRRGWRALATVKQCLHEAAQWMMRIYSGGRG